jgi:hypothetical protein
MDAIRLLRKITCGIFDIEGTGMITVNGQKISDFFDVSDVGIPDGEYFYYFLDGGEERDIVAAVGQEFDYVFPSDGDFSVGLYRITYGD